MLNGLTMPNKLSIINILGGAYMAVSFEEVLKRIETADDAETEKIMKAVRCRFAAAFPDWEVLFISCPRHDVEERKKTLDYLIRYFQSAGKV